MGRKCCFTGYRPQKLPYLKDSFCEEYQRLSLTLTECIRAAITLGYDYFISGFAEGVDLMAAEAVLTLKREGYEIKLEAAIPSPHQTEGWNKRSRSIYSKLLAQADRRIYTSKVDDAYSCLRRDEYMVKESDLVIAVFDGQKGGTAYTVDYARRKKRNLWMINPATFEITKEEGLFSAL